MKTAKYILMVFFLLLLTSSNVYSSSSTNLVLNDKEISTDTFEQDETDEDKGKHPKPV